MRSLTTSAVALAALVATSLLGPASLAYSTPTPPASVPHSAVPVPILSWAACGEGLECAAAEVPLDYDRPAAAKIQLALIRIPATDQAHRIGSLFLNVGGPGDSTVALIRALGRGLFPPAVLARFDLVGFDPRGVGTSVPIRCFATDSESTAFFANVPSFPVGRREQVAFVDTMAEYSERCADRNLTILRHMSTADVARDMDVLRRAVGDEELTYYGPSYGSYLGNTYANLYPGKVRAIVLDGVIEPVALATGRPGQRRLPWSSRIGLAEAAHAAFQEFLTLCVQAGQERCALASGDPRAKVSELLARARRAPLQIPTPDGPQQVTYASIVTFARLSLYDPQAYPLLAEFLEDLYVGNSATAASRDALAAQMQTAADEAPYDNSRDALHGVACSDTMNPRNPFAWGTAAQRAELTAPHFGAAVTFTSLPCATWPPAPDRYTGPFTKTTANPVLVIGVRHDPATPYSNAVQVSQQLPGARLLTVNGWGHTTAFAVSACAQSYTDRYLIELALPPRGTVCDVDNVPFAAAQRPEAVPSPAPR